MTTATLSSPLGASGVTLRKRPARRVLPGFNLTLGYTLLYLSLIVLIPLSALRLVSNLDQFMTHKLEITNTQGQVLLRLTRRLCCAAPSEYQPAAPAARRRSPGTQVARDRPTACRRAFPHEYSPTPT